MRAGSSPAEDELDSADSEAAAGRRREEGGGGPEPAGRGGRRDAAAGAGGERRRRSDLSGRSETAGAGLATRRVIGAPVEEPDGLPPPPDGRGGGLGRGRSGAGRSMWEGRGGGRTGWRGRGAPGDGRRVPLVAGAGAAGREEGEAEREVTLVELLDQLLLEL